MSISATNPTNYMGGTWVEWGSGRVPVGVDTTDSNFNTVEKQVGGNTTSYTPKGSNSGGAVQNHTLTIDEMPSHTHTTKIESSNSFKDPGRGSYSLASGLYGQAPSGSTGGGGAHNHGFTQPTFTGTADNISTIQKSITCYMFKRTA